MAEAAHKSRDRRRNRCRLTGLGTVWCCATSFPRSPDRPYNTTQQKLPLSLPVHSISQDYSTIKNKNKKVSEDAKRSNPTGEVIKQKSFMEKQQRMLSPGRVSPLVEPAAHDCQVEVEVEVELQNSLDTNPREPMIKGGATLQQMMRREMVVSPPLKLRAGSPAECLGEGSSEKHNNNNTKDVRVTLKGIDGRVITLDLHSEVLILQSQYFASKLAECPLNEGLLSVEFCDCSNLESYQETIELMYCGNAKRRLMQGSTPAIAAIGILEVSAKILFDSGVQACLEYLEAMPWTEEEEVRLRNLLSQIHLDRNTVQDVLGRLHLPEHTGPEKLLMHVVQSVTKGTDEKARREMKCLVLRMIRENSIQDNEFASLFKDDLYSLCYGCLDSLVKLFMQATNKNLGNEVIEDRGSLIAQIARQVDNLNWLLEILVDRQIAEDFVRIWANQLELLELYKQTSCMVRYEVSRVTAKLVMTIGKRQILSPCEVRYNLLQAWLQPLVDDFGWIQRCCKGLDMKVVEEAISQTILTLPMKQQQSILLCWMEYFSNSGNDCPNLQKAFEVWWRRSFMPS